MLNALASLHKELGVFLVEFDLVQLHHPVHLQKKNLLKKGNKAEDDYRKKKERKD